jgi:hypothetical protein
MLKNTSHAAPKHLIEKVRCLVGELDSSFPEDFVQAMRSLLAAMEYRDSVLMRSHLTALLKFWQEFTEDAIRGSLGKPERIREAWKVTTEDLKESPAENYDEVGRFIDSSFKETLKDLTDLRDGPVKMLRDRGVEVANSSDLEREIQALEKLQTGILENWPWSDRPLPPVDRQMVAESRAAFARGEKGERAEDLIRKLGGTPSKAG